MPGSVLAHLLALILSAPELRSETWAVKHDTPSPGAETAHALAVDSEGNVYVTASSSPYDLAIFGAPFLVKYDPRGNEVWAVRQDAGNTWLPWWFPFCPVAVDAQQNAYIARESSGKTIVVKYDPRGKALWQAIHGDPKWASRPQAIGVDRDGNVSIAGSFISIDDEHDYTLVQYDPEGRERWALRITGHWEEYFPQPSLVLDREGNLVLGAGFSVLKYNPQAENIWSFRTDGQAVRALATDEAGNVHAVATGTILKFGPDGRLLWAVPGGGDKIAVDREGNVVVAGWLYVRKHDPEGAVLWARKYDPDAPGGFSFAALAVDGEGSVYLAGGYPRQGTEPPDYAVLKLDQQGNELWRSRYHGHAGGPDELAGLVLDGTGKVIVTGTSAGLCSPSDLATVAYAPDGRQLWAARHDELVNGNDWPAALAQDPDGKAYLASGSTSCSDSSLLLIHDPEGRLLETTSLVDREGRDFAPAALAPEAGGYFLAAGSVEGPGGDRDIFTARYGPGHELLWSDSYDGPAGRRDMARFLALDGAGNLHVTGWSDASGGGSETATIKYDSRGNRLWVARFVAGNGALPVAMAADKAGNVWVLVSTDLNGYSNIPVTLKYGPDGAQAWFAVYQGPGPWVFRAGSLALDCAGNSYVAGTFQTSSNESRLGVIKYSPEGRELWAVRTEAQAASWASALAVDCLGKAYVAGFSSDLPGAARPEDHLVLKLDSQGQELWMAASEGAGHNHFWPSSHLALDAWGNAYTTRSVVLPGSEPEIGTLKYSPEGDLLWEGRFRPAGSPRAWPHHLAVDRFGNVHVAGTALSDIVLLKYSTDLTSFLRGDCDGNGGLGLADALSLLLHLYAGGAEPPCLSACDADGDDDPGGLQADALQLLRYLFLGGPAPPPPFPRCESRLPGKLGCTFTSC